MGRFLTFSFALTALLILSAPLFAQEIEIGIEQEEVFTPSSTPAVVLEPMGTAILQTLDKVTGRTGTATVEVGETVKLGTLYLAVRTCRKAPAIEEPEAAAFIQVWQPIRDEQGHLPEDLESEWVFSGWMYASSPSVSAMDHPVYDVWVIDCK